MPGDRSHIHALLIDTADVRVSEFSLEPQQTGIAHIHTAITEHCYCLAGTLRVAFIGRGDVVLHAGKKATIPPGTAHRVENVGITSCRYLVIQGTGIYDFIEVS